MIIEYRVKLGLDELQRVGDQIVSRGKGTPGLQGLFNRSRANTHWLHLDILHELGANEMPGSMRSDWTELTYLQLQAGNTALYVFALAVVFVFLVLAAQYESWKLPLAVILVVPMCLLCSVVGVRWAGMEVTIFTQIGFVVLVGLASKNAILILEFPKHPHQPALPPRTPTVEP